MVTKRELEQENERLRAEVQRLELALTAALARPQVTMYPIAPQPAAPALPMVYGIDNGSAIVHLPPSSFVNAAAGGALPFQVTLPFQVPFGG